MKVIGLVLGGLALLGGALAWAHVGAWEAARTLLSGSLGSPAAIAGTLRETTPLLIGGAAVYVALRAGLFNIGVEGQLLVGALVCAATAYRLPGSVGLAVGLVAGSAAGALWALPAGLIKAYRGGHEVVTTIMLNSVALYLTSALAAGPLKDPSQQSPSTPSISDATRFPTVLSNPPAQLSLATILAILGVVWLWIWLGRSVAGFELSAAGKNPVAARFAGIDVRRTIVRAMVGSGALGGLAGAVQVLAFEGRFYAGMSPGYGFDALGVAILAGGSAFALIPSAVLFGILAKGGTSVQILGVPKGISYVLLGVIILIAASLRYRKEAIRE